jgi:GT2 family glycosyltransferase
MKYPKVTIGILLFGGNKYLPYSIPSILQIEYPGSIEFFCLDYGPEYSAEKLLKNILSSQQKKKIHFFRNEKKLFHSGGHNTLIRHMTGEYYLCASNDMIYDPNVLVPLIQNLEGNKEYFSATGKLFQWNFEENKKTNIIDSLGIGMRPSHAFFDIAQGEKDKKSYGRRREIFGPSGALAIYKKSALESIAFEGEYFDELLHYKDDVDISYRLQKAGGKSLFVPQAHVWHYRQVKKGNRKRQTRFQVQSSFFGNLVIFQRYVWKQKLPVHIFLRSFLRVLSISFYALVFQHSISQLFLFQIRFSDLQKKAKHIKNMPSPQPQYCFQFFSSSFLPCKK